MGAFDATLKDYIVWKNQDKFDAEVDMQKALEMIELLVGYASKFCDGGDVLASVNAVARR